MDEKRFYTYKLAYPKSMGGAIFYVGKGTGNRINHHETEARKGVQSRKCNTIREIWAAGEQVVKEKDAFFEDADSAYLREIELIAFYGRKNLTNGTDGGEGAPPIRKHGARRDYHILLPMDIQNGNSMSLADAFEQAAQEYGGIIAYAVMIISERPEIKNLIMGNVPQGGNNDWRHS